VGASSDIWMIDDTRAVRLDRPCLVGILNITPDSFSDGGEYDTPARALDRAKRLVDEGADMLDVGGESTRPGAARVGEDEQIARVVPVIEAIRGAGIGVPVSVDTTRSGVARAALDAGADVINDVSAGTEDGGMLALAGARGCGVVLMHRLRPPGEDSYSDRYARAPEYGDVVGAVRGALAERMEAAMGAGVARAKIVLDPGLGFGKSVGDNLALIRGTGALLELGRPIYSGISRKSFAGRVGLGRDSEPAERDAASVGLAAVHLMMGARIFRVHDVGAHRGALDAAHAAIVG
jgi:dihydropteroate synthase